ncbi:hypothetical protein OG568_52875 (plasmid) [Streptomyces sp. NBC_01450]
MFFGRCGELRQNHREGMEDRLGALGPVRRIMPQTRGLARPSAALSSLADAPRRLPPPPCSCTHQTPLNGAYQTPPISCDSIRRTGPRPGAERRGAWEELTRSGAWSAVGRRRRRRSGAVHGCR